MKISVVTPIFNEEKNIEAVYMAVRDSLTSIKDIDYEHIFIDNASQDQSVRILRALCQTDSRVKAILNLRNFGHMNSPFYAFTQAKGDAVITFIGDLQDPPELIPQFIQEWRRGHKVVVGVYRPIKRLGIINWLRSIYYRILSRIGDTEHIQNFTGYGLYDKSFVEILRNLDEPAPYFRGLVSDYADNIKRIEYKQRPRGGGVAKNNFYSLYDTAMLGFVNHSKFPIRIAGLVGVLSGILSALIGLGYFIYKLLFWESFQVGVAPLVIGVFFLLGINLFFLGMLGEYILTISERIKRRPLVVEKERINF